MRFSLPGIAASCLVVFAACADGTKNPTAPSAGHAPLESTVAATSGTAVIASLTVSPYLVSVDVGATSQLTPTIKDSFGRTISGASLKWDSSNWNVAWVNASGLVTAKSAGTATISASSGGRTGTAVVTVKSVGGSVASITLAPGSGNIAAIGGTLQLAATIKDSAGNAIAGGASTWDSGNWNVAWVNASGLVTAKSAGTAVISLTSGGKSATATITVGGTTTPPPAPAAVASVAVSPTSNTVLVGKGVQLSVTTTDATGSVLTGRTVTWSSSNGGIATVTATGFVTAVASGSATITATSEGKSGSATIAVSQVPVAMLTVAANSASLTVGQTTQATATTKDASGSTLTGRSIAWSSSNAGVASVSGSGVITGTGAGSATITATSEGKSGSVAVSVTAPAPVPVPVATVAVTPSSASLTTGQSVQLSAATKDASGNALSGRAVTWSSSNSGVASVSASGLVNAVGAGSATITATSEGRMGSASISVATPSAPPVSSGSCSAPTILGSLGFENGMPSSGNASWYIVNPTQGGAVVSDPTANGGMSFHVPYQYNPNMDIGTAVWAMFPQRTALYARMRYKQDPSFVNTGIKKLMRFHGPNGIYGGIAVMWGRYSLGLDALSDGQNRYINVGSEVTPDQLKGGWHTFELMGDISTSGALKYKFWIDGVLKMDYTLPLSNKGGVIDSFQFDGTFNAPGATTQDWLDDLAVSSQCIGTN